MSVDMRSFINFVRSARFGRLFAECPAYLDEFDYLFRIACAALPTKIHDDSILLCMLLNADIYCFQ